MKISPFKPRQFVPEKIDLTETSQLEPLFQRLKLELETVKSVEALEKWLGNYSEVSDALSQSGSITYIEMTCQTDDPAREKAYLKIIETVEPWLKPRQFELLQMLAKNPFFEKLSSDYEVFRRSVKMRVRLYREKNVPLETEEARLRQQYQKVIGAMTVSFDGKEQTLPQMARMQEEIDRKRRKTAWELTAQRRLQDKEQINQIFDSLFTLRQQIAKNAGFADYRDYAFSYYERFDYTPNDCLKFHEAIEKHVVPLARELQQERQQKLGVTPLKPWDLSVDPEQRPALKPFQEASELFTKSEKIFHRLDERLEKFFALLKEQELVDLANRKGKAPGGYQCALDESRVPFIFMNAVGMHDDIETLVHEAGHSFHTLAARNQTLSSYHSAPIEFAEVASMGMELLTAPYWNEFYNEADATRARHDHLEGIIKIFPWIATIDAYQHWLYTHPKHTQEEREQYWIELMNRFGGIEDWSGYETARASLWHRQLHLFEHPFYYVEYGIAQIGALQLWQNAKADPQKAVESYLNGLSLGGSRPLPELFEAAGLQFDFSDRILEPLMQEVQTALKN